MILHLKEIMSMKGINSVMLSEKLGVSKATVSYWINGKVFPDPEKLELIATELGVKVWELFKEPEEDVCVDALRCPHCGHPLTIKIE